MRPRLIAIAVGLGLLAVPAAGAGIAEAKPGTFAGSLGLRVPKGADASVRAISRANRTVTETREVGRRGRFSLRLKPGTYLVVGTVVPKPGGGRVALQRVGVSLKSGQVRKRTSLKKRKRKRRRARPAYVQERGQVTPGRVAVEIPPLTGTSRGDWGALRGGVDDMLITDVVLGSDNCGTTVIEVERRADILRELAFQQSPYVDPSTRMERNFALGDVEVKGNMTESGDNAVVSLDIVDKATGDSLGRLEATLRRDTPFEDLEDLGKRLTEELCKLSDVYEVTLDVNGEGRFATHSGSGRIHAVIRAKRGQPGAGPWEGDGALAWSAVSFTSFSAPCVTVNPVVPTVGWSVTITNAGDDTLQVNWSPGGNDMATASMDCPGDPDPPPIPGQPGPSLIQTGPMSFTVPYAGGTQAITGGLSDGGDGFFNTGSMTVKPSGVARR